MKSKRLGAIVLGFLFISPIRAQEPQATGPNPLKVEIKIGTGIANREIVGVSDSFSSETAELVCWTYIKGATEPTDVRHVWSFNNKVVGDAVLQVKSSSYRTWSRRPVAGRIGEWTLDVKDSEGRVLASKKFTVGQAGR